MIKVCISPPSLYLVDKGKAGEKSGEVKSDETGLFAKGQISVCVVLYLVDERREGESEVKGIRSEKEVCVAACRQGEIEEDSGRGKGRE